MHTQDTPKIISMQVVPVAGHDSMLMNVGGAHGAYFTRNIVILKDNAGHTGVGESLQAERRSCGRYRRRFPTLKGSRSPFLTVW